MNINYVLAVVPVTDIAVARDWYAQLFGREPDNNPMDTLYEWHLTTNGWLQVTIDTDRAGSAQVNLAVDDLTAAMAEITERGIAAGDLQQVNKGVVLYPITDPDGNVLTLIGNYRVAY